jgi:AraC-like DNA-binding protein
MSCIDGSCLFPRDVVNANRICERRKRNGSRWAARVNSGFFSCDSRVEEFVPVDFVLFFARAMRAEWPRVGPNEQKTMPSWSAHTRQLCSLMRANYDQPISLEMLAASVGRNAAYTATLFHRQTGTTIHRYLTRVRMRRAATLLRRSEKVESVMLQVGYRGKKNFYRQFAMAFGVTPGQYKASRGRTR